MQYGNYVKNGEQTLATLGWMKKKLPGWSTCMCVSKHD